MTSLQRFGLSICVALALAASLNARNKIGDKLIREGQRFETQGNFDAALVMFDRALATDAADPSYLMAEYRGRQSASTWHRENGKRYLDKKQLDQALLEFNKALLADPSSFVSEQLIVLTKQMTKQRSEMPVGALLELPSDKYQHELDKRLFELQAPPQLVSKTERLGKLTINNQPARILYATVGKLMGVNVLFDSQGLEGSAGGPTEMGNSVSRNFNLDLTDVTIDEAFGYVALITHTFYKAVSKNAIFVTADVDLKRQEYQDEMIKVFHVHYASTAAEFADIFNAVRTGAKLTTGAFQIGSQGAILVRGSRDTLAVAEKLIHDLDHKKAEIVLEVVVMEVSRAKVRSIGASLSGTTIGGTAVTGLALPIMPNGATTINNGAGTIMGITGSSNATSTNAASLLLSQLGRLTTKQFSLALPSALVEAFMSDSSTRILQRPEVRVSDGGRATLKIGSKIPYVSGSLNSAVATPGSIPYATTQFQQLDVGLNIDFQPHVNGAEDVSMHVKVEVSSVTQTETIAGVQQPIIGQRVNEADIRMRDGEVSLLGGLTQDSDTQSVAGIPGVANLPVLGYVFGTRTKNREADNIIIALVPHIVSQPPSDVFEEGISVGTERITKVTRRPSESGVLAPEQSLARESQPSDDLPLKNQVVKAAPRSEPIDHILDLNQR